MKFIKYYSQEIYTVITLLLITASAIFVTPDFTQKVMLGYILLFLTFVPYFAHAYFWLVLPCVYLGFLEGFVHTASMQIFKLKRSYTPGMIRANIKTVRNK